LSFGTIARTPSGSSLPHSGRLDGGPRPRVRARRNLAGPGFRLDSRSRLVPAGDAGTVVPQICQELCLRGCSGPVRLDIPWRSDAPLLSCWSRPAQPCVLMRLLGRGALICLRADVLLSLALDRGRVPGSGSLAPGHRDHPLPAIRGADAQEGAHEPGPSGPARLSARRRRHQARTASVGQATSGLP